VGDHDLDVAVGPGQPQVRVEGLDRFDAEAHLLPHLVADHDPPVAGGGDLALRGAPRVQAGQPDADSVVPEGLQPFQGQRLDRRGPVDVDVGVLVEHPGEVPGDQLGEGVPQQPGPVEEPLPGLVPAGVDQLVAGFVDAVPQLRDRDGPQRRVAGAVPGQLAQHRVDDPFVTGRERDPLLADVLGPDQAADQDQPPGEHDRRPSAPSRSHP